MLIIAVKLHAHTSGTGGLLSGTELVNLGLSQTFQDSWQLCLRHTDSCDNGCSYCLYSNKTNDPI